ncbi:hypothetical protein RJD24_10070 [Bacillaceae bacterium IKA-2]|nr:hypothetical protein RJD24_10070 [Bacillaceae bacterium IKA-2]
MDIFTMPDKAEGGFGYAYLMMAFLFIVAKFTLYRLKKADLKEKAKVLKLEKEMEQYNNPNT